MPTQKPRVTFTISEEELARVEDFRFSNKIKNQTQAILRLIELGLEDYLPTSPDDNKKSPSFEDGDMELLKQYHKLDSSDRCRVSGYIDRLLEDEKYQKESLSKNA